jgi:hypothetical protein
MGRKRPPIFQSQEYNVKVAEDFPEGSLLFTGEKLVCNDFSGVIIILFTVRVMDHLKAKYSLVSSPNGQEANLFSVNQEHGWITLVNKLDYEVIIYPQKKKEKAKTFSYSIMPQLLFSNIGTSLIDLLWV